MSKRINWMMTTACAINAAMSLVAAMQFSDPFLLLYVAAFAGFGIAFGGRAIQQAAE